MINLICCTNEYVIYGKDTEYGDVDIKFLSYTGEPDTNPNMLRLNYTDFKDGWRNVTLLDKGEYENYIYCRIGGNLYKIDYINKNVEVVDTDFCGVCFMKDYILLAKDEESFYKLTPSSREKVNIN